jgi:hypothetical protein
LVVSHRFILRPLLAMLLNHVLANVIAAKSVLLVLVVSGPLALASILRFNLVGFATRALAKAANNCLD